MNKRLIILAVVMGIIISFILINKKKQQLELKNVDIEKLLIQATRETEYGNYFQAEKNLNRALQTEPKNIIVLSDLAHIQILKGDLEAAKPILEEIIAIHPLHIDALQNTGLYWSMKGDYPQAIEYYTKVIDNLRLTDEKKAEIYYYRGEAYANIQNPPAAIKDLEQLIHYNQEHLYGHSLLCFLYASTGEKVKVKQEIETLLTFNNLDPITYNNMSYASNKIGNFEAAVEYANSGLALDTSFSYLYSNRASALLELNRIDSAKTDLDKSLKINPNNAYCKKDLARYYQIKNKADSICIALKDIELLNYYSEVETSVLELRQQYCK